MNQINTTESNEFIQISNGKILFKFNKNKGTYDLIDEVIKDAKMTGLFYEICFEIEGQPNRISSMDGKQWNWEINEINNELGKSKELNLQQTNSNFQINFKIILFPDSENIFFQLCFKDIQLPQMNLIDVKPLIYHNGKLSLASSSNLKILKNDWQSWSPIELVDLSFKEPRSNVKVERRNKHSLEKKPKKGQILSDFFTVLKNTQSEEQLFLGFITHTNQLTQFTWNIKNKKQIETIDAICHGDSILLEKDDEFKSEILMVSFKNEPQILEEWAEITGTLMHTRKNTSIPVGWCSWYYYWKGITEEKMHLNIEACAQLREEIPLQYIQLDDGYEPGNCLGDWLETDPKKFPSGLKHLVQKIQDAGFKAGLWLAPFVVSSQSKLFELHSDWIIRREDGKKIWGAWPFLGASSILRAIFKDRVYALDLTHPDVQNWLKNMIKTLVKDMGFSYLKIDFIYAGAIEGVRYNRKMTRIQAYRKGLEIIREAAGDNTFILGCGAPFAPSIGIVDAVRVSTDTAPFFKVPFILNFLNKILFANLETIPSVENAMQQNILRYFFHNNFWINDPDALLVRHEIKLSPDEIKFELTAIGLLGGLLMESDNMANLNAGEIRLIKLLLPPSGISARPIDILEKNFPEFLILDINTSFENWKLLGILNWSNKSKDFKINLNQVFHSNQGQYHVFEFWDQKYLGILEEDLQTDLINPHSAKIYSIHGIKETPTLLSSTFHITQGAVEVKEFEFSSEYNSLHISLKKQGKNKGSLFIYIPDSLLDSKLNIEGNYKEFSYIDNLLKLELEFQDLIDIIIDFS